ncbi:MAG: thiamine phosphate synthase [Actinomycetota bacterium]
MAALDSGSLAVYVVTSSGLAPGRAHRDVAVAAIEGGATALQLRAPELSDEQLQTVASDLAERCREAGVLFVVNDRLDVAAHTGAGVHVGQGDDHSEARRRMGSEAVLGISVSSPGQAVEAERAGADYLGVTVWATSTKPEAAPVGIEGLRAVANATSLPVVAIGGIDAENAREALETGAVGVAVVSAVGAAPDPVAATRRLVDAVRAAEVRRR